MAEKQWYLSRNGQVFGPVTEAQLKQSVVAGRVQPTDLLNEAGQPNWVAASAVPGLLAPPKVEPLPLPIEDEVEALPVEAELEALPVEAEVIEEAVVADVIEELQPVVAARVARMTCFACFREVSIEILPGVPTAHCPRCRAAIETGETAGAAPAPTHQAAFAKLESPDAFKERMQKKVAAAEAAAARDGAILGGVLGGIIPK